LKALVTGGTGFIGSHLVETLLQKGADVRCLLRESSDSRWLAGLSIETFRGDFSERESLNEAVKGIDVVFHLAGVTKALHQKTYFEVNALGTDHLIHACLKSSPRIQRFIYLSSQAAAGPCRDEGKKREEDHCDPVSSYGQSKRMGEELALAHAHEIPLVILRPSAVYGPREKDIYTFFKLLSNRIKPCISGGDQRISLCYVQDVIQALLLAAETRCNSGEIFFLCDGRDYRLDEMGDILAQAVGGTAYCVRIPEWVIFKAASFSECLSRYTGKPPLLSKGKVEEILQKHWVCDNSKARNLLGFKPEFPLERGARLTVDWYRREKWL
jgi:nucleoside-diphosphate-sugar epimerase